MGLKSVAFRTYSTGGASRISQLLRKYGTVLGFLAMVVIFSVLSEPFFTMSNGLTVLQQIAMLAITGTGLTVVMITGRIDLSIGYNVSALGILVAYVVKSTGSIPLALAVVLLGAVVIGATNGALVAYVGIPDFIGTLAIGFLISGVNQAFTRGYPVSGLPKDYMVFGQGRILGLPVSVFIMFAIMLLVHYLLSRTRLGRHVYAIGGNEQAAVLSGINVRRNVWLAYVICAIGTAVTAVVLSSRIGASHPLAGDSMLLDAIATVFLGATAFRSGEANLWGTFLGALIIGTMNNGLTLLNVPYYYQLMAKGLIIVIAVTITSIQRRRSS